MNLKTGSFYSTYEELKLGCGVPLNIFIMSFYSTYEELKLPIETPVACIVKSFLQYMWGIET